MQNLRLIRLIAKNGMLVGDVAAQHQRCSRRKRTGSDTGQKDRSPTGSGQLSPPNELRRDPSDMNSIGVEIVGGTDRLGAHVREGRFNSLDRGRLGWPTIHEQADRLVRNPGPASQGTHRKSGRPEASPQLSGGGCDVRHAQNGTAELNPQSSAEPIPRVLRSALCHNHGMKTFQQNLRDMIDKRSVRGLARVAGIDEKTIRNWRDKGDPSNHLKARKFLEALSLPWPQALGEYELTPEWWVGFHAKFDDSPADRAIAHIKAVDWDAMSPVQQQAVRSVVVAFEAAPSAAESEPDEPQKGRRKAG